MPSFKKEEKKVCVKLSCVVEKKPVIQKKAVVKPKVKPKPKPKPKPLIKKKIKKPKPKHKPKPKPKPKKHKVLKQVPVVMPPKKKETIKPIEPEVKKQEIKNEPEILPEQKIEKVVENVTTSSQTTTKEQILQEYYKNNLAKIAQLLQDNLYYPRSARKRGIVGQVIVKFRLATDTKAYDIEIISSNSKILSRAAKKTIKNLSGKFPKPKEELILKVPIDYKLR